MHLKNYRSAWNGAKLVFDHMAAPVPEIMDMSSMIAATNWNFFSFQLEKHP
jgi:hypothetical protein